MQDMSVGWDDNITEDATFTIIRNTTDVSSVEMPEITIYPNPTTDELHIHGSQEIDQVCC